MWTKKFHKLLRELLPERFSIVEDTIEDYFLYLAHYLFTCQHIDVTYYVHEIGPELDYGSIEYCQRAYELGYSALIHDGDCIGFIKEKDS